MKRQTAFRTRGSKFFSDTGIRTITPPLVPDTRANFRLPPGHFLRQTYRVHPICLWWQEWLTIRPSESTCGLPEPTMMKKHSVATLFLVVLATACSSRPRSPESENSSHQGRSLGELVIPECIEHDPESRECREARIVLWAKEIPECTEYGPLSNECVNAVSLLESAY